jgi:aminobenzoyl-glutamate utilization protein B
MLFSGRMMATFGLRSPVGRLSSVLPVLLFFTATLSAQQPDLNQLKREAVSEVDSMQALTQQMVDEIFSFAELGFQEHNTSRYVTGILEENGFAIERGVAGIPTAWVVTWGSGKPVIAFITDLDDIPQASQKPGVAYHEPRVPGAPGHGEGHNSGQAVNVTAALSLKKIMLQYHLAGTLKLLPGVAEELLGAKAFYIREGLFRDVDLVLGCHVGSDFVTGYGEWGTGLVSVQYSFHGKAAHAAFAPWKGRSALDAVELMDVGWNFRREHLRLQQRSHYVIPNGGDQPNVVPPRGRRLVLLPGTRLSAHQGPVRTRQQNGAGCHHDDRHQRYAAASGLGVACALQQNHRRGTAKEY